LWLPDFALSSFAGLRAGTSPRTFENPKLKERHSGSTIIRQWSIQNMSHYANLSLRGMTNEVAP
jgi:hypothetical protein